MPVFNPSSGTSVPNMLKWTYTAGSMAPGKFTTDNAAINLTTVLRLSDVDINGTNNRGIVGTQGPNNVIFMADSSGFISGFIITTYSFQTGYVDYGVSFQSGESRAWSGDYQFSFGVKEVEPIAFTEISDYATSEQGNKADNALANDGGIDNTSGTNPDILDAITLPKAFTNGGITPVSDGTYTVGLGVSTNGTITIQSGIITAVQEATA